MKIENVSIYEDMKLVSREIEKAVSHKDYDMWDIAKAACHVAGHWMYMVDMSRQEMIDMMCEIYDREEKRGGCSIDFK
jgi:hypothetical protein